MHFYVLGPYTGPDYETIDKNIMAARQACIKLLEAGHTYSSPHLNSAHFEVDCKATYEDHMKMCFRNMITCDALMRLPGWENSNGSLMELNKGGKEQGMMVYDYDPDNIPPLYPTELHSPVQVEAFLETVMRMYRIHLSKNADYSPANVLGPGEEGLATRIWDKITRLMNLVGFKLLIETNDDVPEWVANNFFYKWLWRGIRAIIGRIVVITGWKFDEEKVPKHESIEDTLIDLAVYAIIWFLFRLGKWGR